MLEIEGNYHFKSSYFQMPKLRVDTNWNNEREHAPLLQRDETDCLLHCNVVKVYIQ